MLVGAALAFTLSFDDFIISYFVGGAKCQNISAYIYSLRGTINPTVNALSTILIVVASSKVIFDFLQHKKYSGSTKMKLNIKKILSYFGFGIVFVLVVILLIKFNKSESEDNKSQQVLTLFNWGEYLDPQTIIDFEKETKIKVKQVLFSSNELAVTKIKSHNKYDLAILSEYAIDQLIQADFLEKIDKDKLKEKEEKEKEYYSDSQYNDKYKEINKKLPNNFADYAVPYFWGKVVLVYNKKKIKKEEIEDKGFKILKDAKLKVALCNNSRDSLMIGLKANGLSIDNLTPEDLKKAKNWILDLKKEKSDVAFINDQLIDRMLQKNQEYYDVAVAYSGDAKFLKEKMIT